MHEVLSSDRDKGIGKKKHPTSSKRNFYLYQGSRIVFFSMNQLLFVTFLYNIKHFQSTDFDFYTFWKQFTLTILIFEDDQTQGWRD